MQQYLNEIYQEILSEYQWGNNYLLKKTETQGEILYESIDKLFSHLTISSQDCFVDIGSGLGKVVLQFFLMTPIKQSIGIEVLSTLQQISSLVLKRVSKDFPEFFYPHRKIIFMNKDVLKIELPTETSILFINSTCFSQPLLYKISKLIKNLPFLHTILTTRPFYFIRDDFSFQQSVAIECTWDSALCFLYKRQNR